jgi:anti-sigma-K factor RskA
MNPQSFIQSGLLEAYILGLASPQERAEVERMSAAHAEVRDELAAIERSLEGYAQAQGEAPPPWMKGRILERLEEEDAPAAPTPAVVPSGGGAGLTRFVALVFGLATLAFGYLYWQQLAERRALEGQVTTLQQEVADCNRRSDENRLQVANMRSLLITDKKTYFVTAVHNPNAEKIRIDVKTVPGAGSNKYHQLWAIVDNKPVSLGMIQPGSDSLEFPAPRNATMYAISVEDKPEGNATPTVVVAHS